MLSTLFNILPDVSICNWQTATLIEFSGMTTICQVSMTIGVQDLASFVHDFKIDVFYSAIFAFVHILTHIVDVNIIVSVYT